MSRHNKKSDVFKYINTHGNDVEVCWEWKPQTRGGGKDGRPYFTYKGKKHLAYRITYELLRGEIPEGAVLRHSCDNGAAPVRCCNPYHLEPGTHQANMDDMKQRERHGLPHHTVRRVRKLVADGKLTQKEIGELFGLPRETVRDIANRVTYDHVNDDS